ncbi:MAG: aldo/keto reductase [Rhodospirillales bacterium]|jgi:aryl-alcohol dehydrogenase-like predicted oxidoreductase|nr:aldo/keto reductase [Rhodospirillales bacterium]MBT4040496.1 aldo/keto reductase [Rhodospirillales bacterium]MBT4627901.1 aldo/keto reductase [Rhodospirillales bacterium]MBT5351533.1 aldo/keto reductase [Rhodospirillales bacterium]MBT5520008.1 aldo/keto reductase [Rhodospirillales bacterium]
MKYNLLGNTGVQVSQLCMGTMSFGGDADKSESAKMYAACRAKGINFFDCANVYNRGESEKVLGDLIAKDRDELVVTSKCYFKMGDDINAQGGNRRHILKSVEDSLKRLKTDHLDVLFMHQWDDDTPLEETLRALEQLVSQGKVHYLGASNYAAWQIARGLGISARNGWNRFDVLQPMYNVVKRQVEVEILPLAEAENLGVITYSPVGGGLLSGKYAKGAKPAKGRIIDSESYAVRYGEDDVIQTAEKFTALAEAKGIHPVSLAVAWAAAHPAVTSPIIGARNLEQLGPSLEAVDIDMTADLRAEISGLGRMPPLPTDRLDEQV